MNDPKAAAAYHPGDEPVTRPDLDALIAAAYRDINDANRCQAMGIMPATHQLHRRLGEVTAALATDRARADQGDQRISDAPHDGECSGWSQVGPDWYTGEITPFEFVNEARCDCWKSAAPTAEQ